LVLSANHLWWFAENCKNGAGVFRRPTHFVCLLVVVENDDPQIAMSFLLLKATHMTWWFAEN
jgi:hypothetical protein